MSKFYQVTDVDEALEYFQKNGYSPAFLLKINGSDRFEVGDVLCLEKPHGTVYRVKPFETAERIAKKFNTTAERILEDNHITEVVPFTEIYITK